MDQACVTCGKPIDLATAEYTEAGLRCARCSLEQSVRDQEQRVVERDAQVRDTFLRRRVVHVARLHAAGWLVIGIFCMALFPTALAIALAVAAVPVALCLLTRRWWAYWVVMTLDGAAALAILGGGLHKFPWSEWWIPVFASVFPNIMMVLLYFARPAFLPEAQ